MRLALLIVCVLFIVIVAFPFVRIWFLERAHPPVGEILKLTDGGKHVLRRGAGVPVVLVHGASGNLREWTASIFDAVAERHEAIAVDRPGHGWSDRRIDDAYDPRVQARVLHNALTEMGVERPILVGHSWAGTVVLAYALAYPENTGGILFLAGVSHPWPGGVDWHHGASLTPFFGALFAHWLVPLGYAAKAEDGIRDAFSPNEPPENYMREASTDLYSRPASFTANAEDIVNLKPIVSEMAAEYSKIKAPLIVLTGDSDNVIFTHLHSPPLVDKVDGAELRVLEGIGHMPHHAAPDAVLQAIEDLVERRSEI